MTDNKPPRSSVNTPATVEESPAEATPVSEPAPVEVAPDAPVDSEPNAQEAVYSDPPVPSGPVSGIPTPDPQPEQTDNTERPEDGVQDVSQDPSVVPSNDEDPDAAA